MFSFILSRGPVVFSFLLSKGPLIFSKGLVVCSSLRSGGVSFVCSKGLVVYPCDGLSFITSKGPAVFLLSFRKAWWRDPLTSSLVLYSVYRSGGVFCSKGLVCSFKVQVFSFILSQGPVVFSSILRLRFSVNG